MIFQTDKKIQTPYCDVQDANEMRMRMSAK